MIHPSAQRELWILDNAHKKKASTFVEAFYIWTYQLLGECDLHGLSVSTARYANEVGTC